MRIRKLTGSYQNWTGYYAEQGEGRPILSSRARLCQATGFILTGGLPKQNLSLTTRCWSPVLDITWTQSLLKDTGFASQDHVHHCRIVPCRIIKRRHSRLFVFSLISSHISPPADALRHPLIRTASPHGKTVTKQTPVGFPKENIPA